jgi:hypothetical protein
MRMTQNKKRVYEALAHINPNENRYPPYSAASVRNILQDELEYGDFDMANLTRTLKALVSQGLVKCSVKPVDVSGDTGCIHRAFQQERWCYWPTELDLDAMNVKYKRTVEDQDLKWYNFSRRWSNLPPLSMDEYRAQKLR